MSTSDSVPQENGQRSRRGAWLIGIVLAIACAAAYLLGSAANHDHQAKRGLSVAPEKLDFGEVWESGHFLWTLPIQNTTGESLEILNFASSCSCVAVHPNSVVIPAGKTAEVRLTLNLTNGSDAGDASAGAETRPDGGKGEPPSWPFQAQITPQVRGGIPYQESWVVKGRVRRPFHIEPPALDFGENLLREGSHPSRSADIVSYVPGLNDLNANCDGSKATARLEQVAGSPGRYRLTVTPNPSLPSGPFRFQVRITGTTPDRTNVPGFVSAYGVVLRDVYAQPDTVVFGARPTGETCEETLLLRSRSGKAFTVRSVQSDPEGLVAQDMGRVADGKLFRLSQRISELGHRQGMVRFSITGEDGANLTEITVSVAYHGMAPERPSGKAAVSPNK